MTQEQKELLLKDLCARLPYGVKVKILSTETPLTVLSINPNGVTWVMGDTGYPFEIDWENCKTYLFPLSSMTEEQERELNLYLKLDKEPIMKSVKEIDWLNKNHFDYRGLIPMGLAIDATGNK